MALSKKTLRQKCIKTLIDECCVENQEQLAELLGQKGISVTQTTLSRDLAELNVLKRSDRYILEKSLNMAYDNKSELCRLLASKVTEISQAVNMVVVKTMPGSASPLGLEFDNVEFPGVVGNIAGDDTVFVAMASEQSARALIKTLEEMM